MKTTMRNSLLVALLSLICVTVQPSRCEDATSISGSRQKETEKLEELIGEEVIASLQLLEENDDDQSGSKTTNHGYVTSQGEGKPSGKLEISRESDENTRAGEYTKNARELEDETPANKLNPSSYLQRNYQYGFGPSQSVSFDDNPKITRKNACEKAMDKGTREPGSNEFYTYPTTYQVTLPISRSRLSFNRGYGMGGGWGGGLLGRGVRQLGSRFRNRFGTGSRGGGWGYSNGYSFGGGGGGGGVGGGVGGGSGGLTGLNIGTAGRRLMDLGSTGSGGRTWQGSGSTGYTGSGSQDWIFRGRPGSSSGSSGSGLNIVAGNTPSTTYNRYGIPSDNSIITSGSTSTSSGTGESQYRINYPNRASTVTTTQSSTDSSEEDPIQYELLFLQDEQSSPTQSQTITPTTSTNSAQIQLNGGSSGTGTLSSGGGNLRTINTVTTSNDPGSQKVKEYRLVVVDDNKPTTTKSSGQNGISVSSSRPASSSSSWTSVSSSGSPSSGSSWATVSTSVPSGSMSTSRQSYQVNAPNASLQLRLPSSSVVNSVLSSATPAVEQQTRSMSDKGNLGTSKIIRVIPVTS